MKPKIMLDSGAFSVWKRGGEIDVRQYGRFIAEHEGVLWAAVTLDVLPGRPGITRTMQQTEEAAAQSAKNTAILRKMVSAKIPLMPVFHQGERLYWLEKMLKDGYDYIGLSPNKSLRTPQKLAWLDEVFSILAAGGYPPARFHAFGETSFRVLTRYPWESADSTTWIIIGAMGQILVPGKSRQGKPDYQRAPILINVSSGLNGKSSVGAHSHSKSFPHLGPSFQAWVLAYAKDCGFSMKELQVDDKARKMLCAEYFKRFAQSIQRRPFQPLAGAFFQHARLARPTYDFSPHLIPIFVSGTSKQNLFMVMRQKCKHQLISYYDLWRSTQSGKDGKKNYFSLRDYYEQGIDYALPTIKSARARYTKLLPTKTK